MRSLVTSIFLYACESWTLTAELKRRIQAMENRSYRKILHISSLTKTMLPTRKSVPRSSRQLDHMKTFDDRKETQTAVVWSCFPFIRSGQTPLARHSERWKKTRQTEEEVERQHQGMDRPGVRQVPECSGEERKWKKLVVKSSVVPQGPSPFRNR